MNPDELKKEAEAVWPVGWYANNPLGMMPGILATVRGMVLSVYCAKDGEYTWCEGKYTGTAITLAATLSSLRRHVLFVSAAELPTIIPADTVSAEAVEAAVWATVVSCLPANAGWVTGYRNCARRTCGDGTHLVLAVHLTMLCGRHLYTTLELALESPTGQRSGLFRQKLGLTPSKAACDVALSVVLAECDRFIARNKQEAPCG